MLTRRLCLISASRLPLVGDDENSELLYCYLFESPISPVCPKGNLESKREPQKLMPWYTKLKVLPNG